MSPEKAIFAALERISARLDAIATPAVAVKRAVAAKLMGISPKKLDMLIRDRKLRTAEDVRLVPMVEIRRYCAPKSPRKRKPAVGHRARMKHVDGQSEEAWADGSRRIRSTQ